MKPSSLLLMVAVVSSSVTAALAVGLTTVGVGPVASVGRLSLIVAGGAGRSSMIRSPCAWAAWGRGVSL